MTTTATISFTDGKVVRIKVGEFSRDPKTSDVTRDQANKSMRAAGYKLTKWTKLQSMWVK
jgi:hypothetical protein